jgi:hypothetical protein
MGWGHPAVLLTLTESSLILGKLSAKGFVFGGLFCKRGIRHRHLQCVCGDRLTALCELGFKPRD